MNIAYAYLDSVYLHHKDLKQFEGVRTDEAEPCELPDHLPDVLYRVDGGPILLEMERALAELDASKGRFVMMEMTPDKRRYTARAIMQGPRFLAARAELAAMLGADPEGLEMR